MYDMRLLVSVFSAVCRRALLILALLFTLVDSTSRANQYANPIDVLVADPHVLKDGDTYYLYGTSDVSGFKVWSSADLVNWHYRSIAWEATPANWAKNRYWAPEVIKKDNTYYLFYSGGGSPNNLMRICVATSSSPLGPFVDVAAPLFDDGQSWIDAHVFIDSSGDAYLYASQDMSHPADNKSETYVAPLNSSLTALAGSMTLCVTPDAAWEIAGGGFKWNEAPAVIAHGGYYYMFYSGNLFSSPEYAVGYATATHPLGPFTKYTGNPILAKNSKVSGPGHCSIVESPDGTELWMAYHTHQQIAGGHNRHLAIDRLTLAPGGAGPSVASMQSAPSFDMVAAPSGAPAFPAGGNDEFNGTALDRNKWVVFSENPDNFNVSGGSLNLTLEQGDTYGAHSSMRNIFLQYPPYPDFRITAKLNFLGLQPIEMAFLSVWQNHNNYIRFADLVIFGNMFEFGAEVDGVFHGEFAGNTMGTGKLLRLDKNGNNYSCFVSSDGAAWIQIGTTRQFNFIDIKVGFGGSSIAAPPGRLAQFDWFHIEPYTTSAGDWTLYD